ncbi:MAG: hypothetical protein HQL88_08525 [Magnetococcales bacterium]|nr:hypothetical protein [Magnetococcales bacterium]
MKRLLCNPNLPRPINRWRAVLGVVWGLAMLLAGPGLSVAWAAMVSQSGGLTITAERMELDDARQMAIFSGNVRADEKRIHLTADKMTVHYRKRDRRRPAQSPAQKSATPERTEQLIAKIRAEGHVVLVQGDNRGLAEEMIYMVDQKTLDMLGQKENAAIHYGQDRLEGKRILLTIADDHTISKISVQGGEDRRRVSARITPPEERDSAPSPPAGQKAKSASQPVNRP